MNRTIGEWRRLWTSPPSTSHRWWCEQLGFVRHCSEASVLIHPDRHRFCRWVDMDPSAPQSRDEESQ